MSIKQAIEALERASEALPAIGKVHEIVAAALAALRSMPAEPVAWCALTGNGQIAYFDGRPMVMTGPVGNEHHTVPLFPFATPPTAPVPAEPTLKWCSACGEGVTTFCRGKTADCPIFATAPLGDAEKLAIVNNHCLNVGDWTHNGMSVANAIERAVLRGGEQ